MRRSGIPELDNHLNGGIPDGVCLIESEPGSGGTSLALSILREEALKGRKVLFIDTKHGTRPKQVWEYTGEKGLHLLPESGESALDALFISQQYGIKVTALDAIDGIITTADYQLPVGSFVPHGQYRLLKHAESAIFNPTKVLGNLIVLVAHTSVDIRYKGHVSLNTQYHRLLKGCVTSYLHLKVKHRHEKYGSIAWKIIEVTINDLDLQDEVLGSFKTTLYNHGFSRNFALLQALQRAKIIKKSGGIYRYQGTVLGNGVKSASNAIGELYEMWYGRYKQIFAG